MADLTCLEVADSAPGFALDILQPELRARVAAHLIRCPPCRRTVSTMQESADDLLDLGNGAQWDEPEWDEPGLPEVRPGRRRLRMAVSAAAAAVLFVGSTFGPEIGLSAGRGGSTPGSVLLLAGDRAVGTVHFGAGRTAIELEADNLPVQGTLSVVLALTDGTSIKVGELQVDHGRGAWAGSDPVRTAVPTSVILLDASFRQVASANAP